MPLLPRRPLLLGTIAALSLAGAVRPARAEEFAVRESVRHFLDAPTVEVRRRLAAELVAAKPDFARVAAALAEGRTYRKDVSTGWLERTHRGSDGKDRPYLLYVPRDYDPAKRYRWVMELHCGVSRPALLTHEELGGLK